MTANLTKNIIGITTLVILGLGGVFVGKTWVIAQVPQGPSAPAAFKSEEPPNRGLDANLYMQTAAEYRACCFQAYNLATFRLKEAISKKPLGKVAVIMDLDETVFDNAGFQAMQLRSNLAYDQRLWDLWEEKHSAQVDLIPGAKEFILEAGTLGVSIIHISNRNEKFRDKTNEALKRLGIPCTNDKLLKLSTDTSDKTKRRQEAEKDFNILLYIGDNLRDFDESFRCRKIEKMTPDEFDLAIKERKATVDKYRDSWGNKWIIIPNPAYGEWMKPLGQGRADLDRLAPTMPTK